MLRTRELVWFATVQTETQYNRSVRRILIPNDRDRPEPTSKTAPLIRTARIREPFQNHNGELNQEASTCRLTAAMPAEGGLQCYRQDSCLLLRWSLPRQRLRKTNSNRGRRTGRKMPRLARGPRLRPSPATTPSRTRSAKAFLPRHPPIRARTAIEPTFPAEVTDGASLTAVRMLRRCKCRQRSKKLSKSGRWASVGITR